MELAEVDDDYIRDYLRQQLDYFQQPFVEKKAELAEHQDIEQEFGELLGEITKDEEIIKTLIDLASFLLDKTEQERNHTDEVRLQWQDNILQINQQVEFEKQIAKQYQKKMYDDQLWRVNAQVGMIERQENDIIERDDKINLLMEQTLTTKLENKKVSMEYIVQMEENEQQIIAQLQSVNKELKEGKIQIREQKSQLGSQQDSYSALILQMENILKENTYVKNERMKLDQELRKLSTEMNNFYEENQQQEEEINFLRKQLFEMEQQFQPDNRSKYVPSGVNSSRQSRLYSVNNLKTDLLESDKKLKQLIEDGKLKLFQPNPIVEQDEGEASQPCSNQHSKKPTLQEIENTDQRSAIQKVQEKRLRILKLKLDITSKMTSQVNTPRAEFPQPITQRNTMNKIQIPNIIVKTIAAEEDFEVYVDGRIEQKYFPRVSNSKQQVQLQVPKIQQQVKPKIIYDSFIHENSEYFDHQNSTTQRPTLKRLVHRTFAEPNEVPDINKLIDKQVGLRRDTYEEFFELISQCVKLNSPFMDQIIFVFNYNNILQIQTQDLYVEVKKKGIPFNEWYKFVQLRIYKKLGINV